MNKIFRKLFIIASLAIFLFVLNPINAFAQNHDSKLVTLPKNEVVNKDYFAGGETVTLSGTINGDAYVAGSNIIVDGTVNGDLLAAGGTVTIQGKVTQDVRVAGGQINVSGEIGRNLTTVGGTVTILDSAKIKGSCVAGAGNISIFAPIGKEFNFGAGQVTLGNKINGDMRGSVGQLLLTSNARVLGDLTYWSDTKAQVDQGAQVTGNTIHKLPPQTPVKTQKPETDAADFFGFMFFMNLVSFLSALVIGFLMVKFMPVSTQQTANVVTQKPLLSFGIGILAVILFPAIFIFLLITIIGIPAAFILLAIYLIAIYLIKIFIAVALGRQILSLLNKKASLEWIFVLGLVIYYVLTWIPVVGFLFWVIAGITGLGAIIIQKKEIYLQLRQENKI